MAMTLRLNDADTEALRRKAAAEGRSMQAVARDAIVGYVYDRPAKLRALVDEIIAEDQELLDRLAQ
jgi:predicted transcriptional regulator